MCHAQGRLHMCWLKTHLRNLEQNSSGIGWEQNTKCPVWITEKSASYHWMCTCIIWGSCENEILIQQVSVGAWDSAVFLTNSQVMLALLVHRPHRSSQDCTHPSALTTHHTSFTPSNIISELPEIPTCLMTRKTIISVKLHPRELKYSAKKV